MAETENTGSVRSTSGAVEQWVRIPSFPDYIVSDAGRIRHRRANAPILRGSYDKDGYKRVNLDGCTLRVHAIVCEAFHGPRPEGMECAHLDGDNKNNAASNLAWVTRSENTRHQVAHGTFAGASNLTAGNARLSDETVAEIRADAASGMGGRKLAAKYGIDKGYAYRLTHGQRRAEGQTPNNSSSQDTER
jgi:hypothetical protein